MKINIIGKGVIPGIGTIPPVYNRELSERAISRLLNFPSFKLYDSTSGMLITKKNLAELIANSTTTTGQQKETKTETTSETVKIEKEVVEEDYTHNESGLITEDVTPVVETPVEEVVEETVDEDTAETVEDDVKEETVVEETSDETTEDPTTDTTETKTFDNRKKNKKRR